MTPVEKAMARCKAHALEQQYCWFRVSFAKIGNMQPTWVAWFEYAGKYNPPCDHTQGDPVLLRALQKLIKQVGI